MSEDGALAPDESDANDDHASDRGLTLEYRGPKFGGPIERRSCTPGTGEFVNRQPFVPAVIRKGRPKCGESVLGYIFVTDAEGVGYYRDTLEDRARRGLAEKPAAENPCRDPSACLPHDSAWTPRECPTATADTSMAYQSGKETQQGRQEDQKWYREN